MRALLVSRAIPADALCTTGALPDSMREATAALLSSVPERPKLARLFRGLMNADRFVPTDTAVYEPVRRAMLEAG
jgi:ABC-type phosphate/phosphonate transport system substrate-binding protein